MKNSEVDDAVKRIEQRTTEYIDNEAKCGEDVQKANMLKRLTLSGLNKMKEVPTEQ